MKIWKNGWTLAELMFAIIIILIITGLLIHIFKPNTQKARIFMYAMIKNINKGNSAVMEKYSSIALDDENDEDWYCVHFADMFTLKSVPKCDKTLANKDVNLEFPNGVTIQGLANDWLVPYDGAEYSMKNIVVDIDGQKGKNKIWVDRFPLKILNGGKYTGTVRIVDCSDDSVYNTNDLKVTLTTNTGLSPYCKQKFDATGTAVSKGISKTVKSGTNIDYDANLITYDVYRATSSDGASKAKLVASALSPMEADCAAYGGDGVYNREVCAQNKIKMAYRCATATFCETCATTKNGASICPPDPDNDDVQTTTTSCATVAGKYNADNLQCFTLLHKPNLGMNFFLDAVIGEIDM